MPFIARLRPDPFLLLLLGTIALAAVLPIGAGGLRIVGWIANGAIFTLFFLHGARLKREAIVGGIRNWRLQAAILGFGFVAFPLLGWGASIAVTPWLPAGLALGVLFLSVLPTTVQSSIAYASIAGGNVAGSVIASAASNLIGVVATPLLLALLAGTAFGAAPLDNVGKVAALLLLPFAIGQMLHTRLAATIERHKVVAGRMDRLTIVLAVFIAFAEASADGLWSRIGGDELAIVAALSLAMLLLAFAAAWLLGGWIGLDHADRASLLFAAAHKSLATGAPMARILLPPALAGPAIVPLLLYHQLQLMLSAIVAARLAKRASAY
jgi:solute carrier family 10 (sodium/bile acid cotransporter), member 7